MGDTTDPFSLTPPTGRGLPRTPINTPAMAPMPMPGPQNSGPPANHPPRQASSRGERSILRDNTEETPEERLLRMQEHFQKVVEFTLRSLASTFDRSLSSSDRRGGTFRAPLDFNSERPKEWLMQINQYYNALQMNDEARLADVAPFLTGTAVSYDCTTKRRAPALKPTTWEQFQHFIMQIFGMTPLVTTIRRLKEIEYKGSFALKKLWRSSPVS
ncbi:hypothetical protein EBH_0037220 [Eimeria brunetti]|uniref:Uncharacterized protein n=1 Tax=Eimeria brunetti TaxID=51314 RepID=U6LSW1_9EIME|nr:hypothetical protein EBH_0037220 [Eimeria brunetti]